MPSIGSFQTAIVKEGTTSLVVPALSEPKMLPAFFNPKGKFVRDTSITCYKAYSELFARANFTYADSLGGIGARGVRVAKEVPSSGIVCINDINSVAILLAKESARINGISEKCAFSNKETCSFLTTRELISGERFDIVDVDPFGTPSPFVDCAIRAVEDGGLLSMSATDSAVLCGVYPAVAQRKYSGISLRTDYAHEVGMRLIFGLAAMTAMRLEVGISPLFCHHDMHYFRVYFQVNVGNRYSRENDEEIGFVIHCFSCGYRAQVRRREFFKNPLPGKRNISGNLKGESGTTRRRELEGECPNCSNPRLKLGGPLWVGKIQSRSFVESCAKQFSEDPEAALPLFDDSELDIPLYYDLTALSQEMRTRTPKISDVLARLQANGHPASRTRLNPGAIRTSAPLGEIHTVVRELAL